LQIGQTKISSNSFGIAIRLSISNLNVSQSERSLYQSACRAGN
jgi:hypothetical protein